MKENTSIAFGPKSQPLSRPSEIHARLGAHLGFLPLPLPLRPQQRRYSTSGWRALNPPAVACLKSVAHRPHRNHTYGPRIQPNHISIYCFSHNHSIARRLAIASPAISLIRARAAHEPDASIQRRCKYFLRRPRSRPSPLCGASSNPQLAPASHAPIEQTRDYFRYVIVSVSERLHRQHVLLEKYESKGHPAPELLWPQHARAGDEKAHQ